MQPRPLSCTATALAFLPLVALAASSARALPSDDDTAAKVTIVAVSDFQCPFCARADATLDQLGSLYGGALSVRFMHNPLPFHANAKPAAIASEAARKQGAFAAYATRLFANHSTLDAPDLERFASELGLDLGRFKADLGDTLIADKIALEQRIAAALGATGTPCFFINGRELRGAQPIDQFQAIIDDEIALSDKAGRRGPAWIAERTRANKADLADYLAGVKQPPATAPKASTPEDTAVYRVTVDEARDAIRGPLAAPVTLVVFSDFQCPFCARHMKTLDALRARYGDKVRLVYKHHPLPFHNRAVPAAHAALCAKDQGKFWEMHDRLYSDMNALGDAELEASASALGLDVAAWSKCVAGAKHQKQLDADSALAGDVTARGTPTTFVNGRKYVGARAFEDFVVAVDDALKEAEAKLATGVAPATLYATLVKDGKVFEVLEAKVEAFTEKGSPILGKASAKVHIVVVGDFQCPFCARAAPVLPELVAKYPGKVAVIWKNYPLGFHDQAVPAARVALCANEQGKFWAAAAWLYERSSQLESELPGLAEAIKLDRKKLDACLASKRPDAILEKDLAEVQAAGVRGTPTLYLNGRKLNLPGGYSLETMSPIIEEALRK